MEISIFLKVTEQNSLGLEWGNRFRVHLLVAYKWYSISGNVLGKGITNYPI